MGNTPGGVARDGWYPLGCRVTGFGPAFFSAWPRRLVDQDAALSRLRSRVRIPPGLPPSLEKASSGFGRPARARVETSGAKGALPRASIRAFGSNRGESSTVGGERCEHPPQARACLCERAARCRQRAQLDEEPIHVHDIPVLRHAPIAHLVNV